MSDDDKIDFFFARLKADPQLAMLAVVLAPYRVMAKDPASLVATLDALAAHWFAATHQPVESET